MGFPDSIQRTIELKSAPAKVWSAITTADGLASWFGDTARIDLRPGGEAQMTFGGEHTANMRVERVEEPSAFGFTWHIYGLPEDDPRRTYFEFTLEPKGGGTRLTVVETGFAQLSDDAHKIAFEGNTRGWRSELDELIQYLDAA